MKTNREQHFLCHGSSGTQREPLTRKCSLIFRFALSFCLSSRTKSSKSVTERVIHPIKCWILKKCSMSNWFGTYWKQFEKHTDGVFGFPVLISIVSELIVLCLRFARFQNCQKFHISPYCEVPISTYIWASPLDPKDDVFP